MKSRAARVAPDAHQDGGGKGGKSDSSKSAGGGGGVGCGGGGKGGKSDSSTLGVNGQQLSGGSATGGGGGTSGASVSGSSSSAAAIRKRRSSINVYDQPSSLNSRLRQLETDVLRLDEDRTKLYDDTHSALASFELRVSEIHAILKSRQDNVEKYVEDMRALLAAKDEFEKQTKQLTEKQDRIHDKFTHRETIVARDIKLLRNKFELLEKSRQFKSLMQRSGSIDDDNASGGQHDAVGAIGSDSIVDSARTSLVGAGGLNGNFGGSSNAADDAAPASGVRRVRLEAVARMAPLKRALNSILRLVSCGSAGGAKKRRRRQSKVGVAPDSKLATTDAANGAVTTSGEQQQSSQS